MPFVRKIKIIEMYLLQVIRTLDVSMIIYLRELFRLLKRIMTLWPMNIVQITVAPSHKRLILWALRYM